VLPAAQRAKDGVHRGGRGGDDWNGVGAAAAAAKEDSNDFWDQRLRLKMNWQVADGVTVAARADILENIWQTGTGAVPAGDADKEIDFDWAYAMFNWGTTTLSVGKMDVTWGTGAYAALDNRYRLKITGKYDTFGWGFAWDTFNESQDTKAYDDDQGYSAWVTGTVGGWSSGLLGIYRLKDDVPGVSENAMAIDAFAKGAFGNAKINAEAFYGWGTKEFDSNAPDQDGSSFLGYVGAFLPIGPVGAGFEVAYATGNDPSTYDDEGAYIQDYQGPFTSFILFNNFDLPGWVSVPGMTDKGVANALALKASGTFAVTPQFSLMGALVWAQADEKVAADKKTPTKDDDMGFEVDLLAKYALTANVTVQAGFGYLAAGDYWGDNVDDPWVATAHAVVTF
jgi:hypothetical protein